MDLPERLDVLRRATAFSPLTQAEMGALAEATDLRHFESGDVLMRQGDEGDALWVLARGECEVRLRLRDETSVLASLEAGEVVGEMALVTGAPRTADVVATTSGEALVLGIKAFESITAKYPDVVSVLTELVAARLGRAAQDGLGDKVLEGYRIIRPVGRGATAVVYEAEQLSTGRRTALKMLSHKFSRDREAMELFERESAVLDDMEHECVARSYGRFDAYGTRFLAIEYVDGVSGQAVLAGIRRPPLADALAIAGSVAAALEHSHSRGVIHCDVKPANVMIGRDGRVVLTDFGIAARVTPHASQGGRISGTPQYMAPEMFVGARPCVSTDIYALGCLLHDLAAGAALFPEQGLGPLLLAKRRFDAGALLHLPEAFPADLRATLVRMLDPDPARRPQSAGELGLAAGRTDPALVARTLAARA